MKIDLKNKEIMTKQHEKVFHTMKVNNEKAIEAHNKCWHEPFERKMWHRL